jgi:hypothetical protein
MLQLDFRTGQDLSWQDRLTFRTYPRLSRNQNRKPPIRKESSWITRNPDPHHEAGRIATSGHSLGAKPALILGMLDPRVKAIVWNHGITNWRERAVATNLERIGTSQYVPGLLAWFDYPDLQASPAPRHFLVTEGGRSGVLRFAWRLADRSTIDGPDGLGVHHGARHRQTCR